MDSQIEESLIGYVLGSLDPDEQRAVEIQISKNPAVRSEIQLYSSTFIGWACLPPRSIRLRLPSGR
jgi:anti-sigma-K factor RskA